MKKNSLKKNIQMKELLDDASPDHIENFIVNNKNSDIPKDMLENVKLKVFEKTGIENTENSTPVLTNEKDENTEASSSALTNEKNENTNPTLIGEKNENTDTSTTTLINEKDENEVLKSVPKKINYKRWLYAAACVILAVAVVLGMKHFNFGNPPVTNSEDESGEIVSKDNSTVSENVSETVTEDNSNDSSVVTPENFEIKGINWADEGEYSSDRVQPRDLVLEYFANEFGKDYSWTLVKLKSLHPIGQYEDERIIYDENGTYKFPDYYFSVAEIEIKKIYYRGADEGKLNEGETIKIVVPWICEGDKVNLKYPSLSHEEFKVTEYLPMTEIGNDYVVGIRYTARSTKKVLQENAAEYSDLMGVYFSFPMGVDDFSKLKGMSELKIPVAAFQIYVAFYEQFIKKNVEANSPETMFYNGIKGYVYSRYTYLKTGAYQNILKKYFK